ESGPTGRKLSPARVAGSRCRFSPLPTPSLPRHLATLARLLRSFDAAPTKGPSMTALPRAVALAALLLSAPAFAAKVEMFSPQGEVKGVRQVAARFSEAMVA